MQYHQYQSARIQQVLKDAERLLENASMEEDPLTHRDEDEAYLRAAGMKVAELMCMATSYTVNDILVGISIGPREAMRRIQLWRNILLHPQR